MTQSTTRESFVEAFGEEQAAKFEAAAEYHRNGINDSNKGSDPFKWAASIVIGYQCAEVESYRGYHGITPPWEDIDRWLKEKADLGTHDGDMDILALFAGTYDKYAAVTP